MLKRALQPILMASALCSIPWIGVLRPSGALLTNPAFGGFLVPLPFLLLGGLAFLGAKLNQNRLFFVSLFFSLSYVYARGEVPLFPSAPLAIKTLCLALATPVTLGLILLSPEGRLWNWRSAVAAPFAVGPLLAITWGVYRGSQGIWHLLTWRLSSQESWLRIPDSALICGALFALSTFAHRNSAKRLLHGFLALSLFPLFAAFHFDAGATSSGVVTALSFVCASGLLVYAVFLLYWERVYIDELTGIPNRRALNEQLARLSKRYALAMIDIDHFKRFNDTYGHEEGDNVLRFIAAHLDRATKGHAYRFGGEEFTVLLDKESEENLSQLIDSARRALADRRFTLRPPRRKADPKAKLKRGKGPKSGVHVQLTFSAGVAGCPDHGSTPEEVLLVADETLYAAKESGRNCVASASSSPPRKRRQG